MSYVSNENFSLFVEGSLMEEGDKCIVHMVPRKKSLLVGDGKVGAGQVAKLSKIHTSFL